jgi:hypothetical protein
MWHYLTIIIGMRGLGVKYPSSGEKIEIREIFDRRKG